ncbi:MAG: hypothetical protein ABL958_11780, partial [Bdellovibrionia bacterium]
GADAGALRAGLGALETKLLPLELNSLRREQAVLRIARTLADLDSSAKIKCDHLNGALEFGALPFRALRADT